MIKQLKNLSFLLITTCSLNYAVSQTNQWSASNKFTNCINSMRSTNDEHTRFNFAMNFFLTEHTTTIQLIDACHFLTTDNMKYELCVAAYPNIMNKDHFFNVYNSFSSFSYAIKLYHNTQQKTQTTTLQNEYELSHQHNNDHAYELLMEKGDLLVSNNQYDEALLIYNQALELKPGNQNTTQKIQEVNNLKEELAKILTAEQQLNAQFDQFIQQGDIYLTSNQVDQAITMYEQAMNLKPGDQIAYNRIKEANNWKMQMNNMADVESQKKTEFDFLIQKGDILVSSLKYDEAIAEYQKASSIYPSDQTPFIKIEEAKRLKIAHTQATSVCTTSDTDFGNIKTSIKDQTFSNDMMEMAKKHIQKKCLSIEQMMVIVKLFSMDNDKLKMIKYMYNYSQYQDRFYEFRSLLTFSSTKKKLDEFLVSK